MDREYKDLNKWYEKADTLNTWIYFNEKTIDEESSGSSTATIPAIKEQMEKNQVFYIKCGNLFINFTNASLEGITDGLANGICQKLPEVYSFWLYCQLQPKEHEKIKSLLHGRISVYQSQEIFLDCFSLD